MSPDIASLQVGDSVWLVSDFGGNFHKGQECVVKAIDRLAGTVFLQVLGGSGQILTGPGSFRRYPPGGSELDAKLDRLAAEAHKRPECPRCGKAPHGGFCWF